jgi:hypothetical protein
VFDSKKIIVKQLSTRGGPPTKLLTFEDAIEFVMVLPGKTACQLRKQFQGIIARYLDGDRSMSHEIKANKKMGKIKSYTKFACKVMDGITDANAAASPEMPAIFYVYATKSPAFPGLIKIGKTEDVERRVCQLNNSCAPSPHVVVAVAQTFDNDRDEKAAHMFFASARCKGEFFTLQDADVIAYFATHITVQFNAELIQYVSRLQGLSV